ncbi:autophagy protein 16, interacts with Atg12p-Atg5p [Elasticomyces elasticus]|nr:autophagy protein 16, interacts with Atg12p-Atg5p [Elasticomyces elasticus]KAK3627073.1 autophagy protein 16, interacts with Atg12p-Atg5p [Elasticomyces elasticus]KAK4904719.1 autophagy protein 16, interacts with Atg12p-Atg5p [Elasticomyces elasticus]KAK5746527.1 autophagy protein 16, interacts with Atg12p-Atg5p [Elasticomyces elasticus]
MSDWIEQYSAALTERDVREKAHKVYIDAYTKLADRTAALAANTPPSPIPASPSGKDRAITPVKGRAAPKDVDASPNDLLARLRADLTTTQKARSTLQAQVAELTTSMAALQTSSKSSTSQLAQLTRQKADTERKLRDRDEELRGKSRLVEQAHDEMVALGLQLSMAEQRSEKLTRENKELVDRWMKRMGEEAEKVNRDSRWE